MQVGPVSRQNNKMTDRIAPDNTTIIAWAKAAELCVQDDSKDDPARLQSVLAGVVNPQDRAALVASDATYWSWDPIKHAGKIRRPVHETALHLAAVGGKVNIARWLITEAGAVVDAPSAVRKHAASRDRRP